MLLSEFIQLCANKIATTGDYEVQTCNPAGDLDSVNSLNLIKTRNKPYYEVSTYDEERA